MAIKKPPIKPILPPVRPPIEPLEVPEEEPIEPIEPPVEPVELYPLIARLYPAFPALKPEELEAKMAELSSWAQEDPEAFLYDLDFRATPEESDIILRALGVPEEYFVARETVEARITELVAGVYPDLTPEEFIEYVETDWESFLGDIKTMPRTIASDRLLHFMGFTPRDLEAIYGVSDSRKREMLQIGGIPEDEIEKIIELSKLDLDAEGWLQKFKDINPSFAKDFLNSLPMRSVSAGYGDLVSGAAGVAGWADNEELRENLMGIADSFQSVAPPVEEWDVSLKTLLDPRFWSTVVARALPFSVAMIPISLMTFGTGSAALAAAGVGVWKAHLIAAIFGGVSGAILESSFEAGSVWNEAKNMGWTDEDADKAAQSTFTKGVGALTGTNAIQLFAMFLPDPTRTLNTLVGRGWATVVRVGGKIVSVSLTEGGEEAIQNVIERQALGLEVKWDNEMKMAFMVGAIMGFGMGGAADVLTTITDRVSKQLPTDVQPEFDAEYSRLKADGASDEQARIGALDSIGDNKEVQDITDRVVEEVIKEEQVKSVKPVDKTERLAWEHIAEPEAVVTPEEVPAVPEVPRQLSLKQVSGLETRVPLDLIRKDESVEIERLTREIREEGITEPITIRVREDGSQIVWDGLHRLIVAQDLGLENIPVQYIGEIAKLPAVPEVIMGAEEAERLFREGKLTKATEAEVDVVLRELLEPEVYEEYHRLLDVKVSQAQITAWFDKEAQALFRQGWVYNTEERAWYRPIKPPAVEVAKPPVEKLPAVTEEIIGLPPPVEPVTTGIAENTQGLNEITAKEEVRPSRKVFIKMGVWRDFYKPMSRAEAFLNEEKATYDKERRVINKLVGKDEARRALVWDEVNNKGSVVGLTFNEKRAVTKIREWADKWADRKNMAQSKRIKDYIPHLFEEEMLQQIREENGIDPVLARILDERFGGKITDPFLKQRLGKEIGLLKDPIACMEAYDNVALKTLYYAPLLNKLNAYMSDLNIPEGSRQYLRNYARRLTGELSNADVALNKMIAEFAPLVRGAPVFGEWMYNKLTTGNPAGMAAYNLTGALYGLWMGFKPTTAIRNLGQHSLIIADVGPVYFAEGFPLGLTEEGRGYWRDSVNRRSRKRAFMPGYDSSLVSKLPQQIINTSLKMFRGADWVNTHSAFMAGCAEAKSILTKANDALPADKKLSQERLREYIIDRGDEVFADTQYLYTKMNSMAFAQNAPGRVLSMLTTWTENWMELMAKWIKRTPSQVYLEFEQQTGAKVARANWATSYKAILMYMLIVGLGYAIKERTRLKAWEYTGLTSVRYLADIMGGDFPALQAPGAVADVVVGFLTGDERRLKEGLYKLRTTFTPAVMRQLDSIAAGDKDWLTFFFYVEGRNIVIKRLKETWEKDWEDYPVFETAEERQAYILEHKDYAGLTDAKMRNKWREDNPLLEAQMFIVGKFTVLSTDKARAEVLRLIEEHKIDTELIDGYEKVFGVDTQETLKPFENRLGNLEVLEVGKEAEYFTMGDYVSEINKLVNSVGRHKVQTEGTPLTRDILEAQDTLEAYEVIKEGDARTLWRQQYPEAEALMYLLGKVSSFKNPKSAEILLGLMKKYDIPPQAIRAFIDDPSRYDELFTQKFELEQKWFDQTTEYENFGNTEAPNYIEDKEERRLAREKFKEDNPDWVADMRRIEAIDNDASDVIIERWVERGVLVDRLGANSAQAKLWRYRHPKVDEWAIENFGWEPLFDDPTDLVEQTEKVSIWTVPFQWEEYENKYDEFDDGQRDAFWEQARLQYAKYLVEGTDYLMKHDLLHYALDRLARDATKLGLMRYAHKLYPEKPIAFWNSLTLAYVGYRLLPSKPTNYEDVNKTDLWLEDDWYLVEHPEFYKAMVEKGLMQERDFSKIPTRGIFAKYLEYVKLPQGKRRDDYRWENQDLDAWLVKKFDMVPITEKRRRARLTPTEEFLEEIAEKEAEFDRRMKELEELLAGVRT